jgi:hypothetical protein
MKKIRQVVLNSTKNEREIATTFKHQLPVKLDAVALGLHHAKSYL